MYIEKKFFDSRFFSTW